MTRTLTGLYDSYDDAAATVRALEAAGIGADDISLLANKAGVVERTDMTEGNEAGTGVEAGAAFGAIVGGTTGLLAGLGMLAIPGIGPVVAAGWIVAAAIGAAGGAIAGGAGGGVIGAMIGNGVSEEDAHVYAEGVRRGGCLVTARVADNQVETVEAILAQYPKVDPKERAQTYRDAGWTGFDEHAPVYTEVEVTRTRQVHSSTPFPLQDGEALPGRIAGPHPLIDAAVRPAEAGRLSLDPAAPVDSASPPPLDRKAG